MAEVDMTQVPTGLTTAQARERFQRFGPNVVAEEHPHPVRRLLQALWGPVPWLLEVALVLQLLLGNRVEAAVLGGLLLFNAVLAFVQAGRAGKALEALKRGLAPTALVRRDGAWLQLPAAELVPDDVVRLSLGAIVPADAVLVSGTVLVDQSMLTGESVPVEVTRDEQVYAGGIVRRGEGLAVVRATGAHTYFGRAAELVRVSHAASTEQAAILWAARGLALVNGTVAGVVLLYACTVGLPWPELMHLALTILLATIPVALPATFALSAALSAQRLARSGVLLTRLSAAHEAATMDVLCSDKTGTLTRNELQVVEVSACPTFDRGQVLELARLASADAGQDPIDLAIGAATAEAKTAVDPTSSTNGARVVRFVPFDPETKMSEATVVDAAGRESRILKGAFSAVARLAAIPPGAQELEHEMAARGHRVLAVAAGPTSSPRLAGLIAVSDPPRDDSAALIAALRDLGVRTVMVTGDSAVTAAAIARQVGIEGEACSEGCWDDAAAVEKFGIFARVAPEEKHRLVTALQRLGHVVGMCGDGTNDAPALRQAQIGIAVATATDAAKVAAGLVLTEPGLAGVVAAVQEGRTAFQRLLAYTLNMLIKKIEVVVFVALGLLLTGSAILTPVLMVLMLVTNDFLSMSLTTDRASFSPHPAVWRMPRIISAAVVLGLCKLAFSTTMLVCGQYGYALGQPELQTLALISIVYGNQAMLYVVRERRRLWSSRPSGWVLVASVLDVGMISLLALTGVLMAPLPWQALGTVLICAAAFAPLLDQVKLWTQALLLLEPQRRQL